MSTYMINLAWERSTIDNDTKSYNQNHRILFPCGSILDLTSPEEFYGDAGLANPEQLLIASVSSCFLLCFLSIAANRGFIVTAYVDQATGELEKIDKGHWVMSEIIIQPVITFQKDNEPDLLQLREILGKAYSQCFIIRSLKTKVTIKPEYPEIDPGIKR